MASPLFGCSELGNAHSRSGFDQVLGWAILPELHFRTCMSVEPRPESAVVPRKGYKMQNGNCVGHFAVRGMRGRAVGSHPFGCVRTPSRSGSKLSWCSGPIDFEFTMVLGSPNKSFKRTPNTPRSAANAFGIISQHSAPRSAPFN